MNGAKQDTTVEFVVVVCLLAACLDLIFAPERKWVLENNFGTLQAHPHHFKDFEKPNISSCDSGCLELTWTLTSNSHLQSCFRESPRKFLIVWWYVLLAKLLKPKDVLVLSSPWVRRPLGLALRVTWMLAVFVVFLIDGMLYRCEELTASSRMMDSWWKLASTVWFHAGPSWDIEDDRGYGWLCISRPSITASIYIYFLPLDCIWSFLVLLVYVSILIFSCFAGSIYQKSPVPQFPKCPKFGSLESVPFLVNFGAGFLRVFFDTLRKICGTFAVIFAAKDAMPFWVWELQSARKIGYWAKVAWNNRQLLLSRCLCVL